MKDDVASTAPGDWWIHIHIQCCLMCRVDDLLAAICWLLAVGCSLLYYIVQY
jgi:hypothetical protein